MPDSYRYHVVETEGNSYHYYVLDTFAGEATLDRDGYVARFRSERDARDSVPTGETDPDLAWG